MVKNNLFSMATNIRNVIKVVLLILVPWIFIVFTAPLYNKPYPELGWLAIPMVVPLHLGFYTACDN